MSANPRPDAGLKPVTVPDFLSARAQGRKLVVVTAYDYALARIVDSAGVDSILVGDSLGMVVQGHHHCLEVTLRDVIYHTRCVQRAVQRALIVADLPFMTYQVSAQQAVKSAGKLVQKGGAHAVKLEGGERSADAIRAIVDAEIPVMGHVGLTPQSVRRIGGFRVQRDEKQIIADAKAVEAAGAFAVVIECVPATVAAKVTAELKIPTIGIGAGSACDGQVLVGYDLLGMFDDVRPKFAKRYAEIGQAVKGAVADFCKEVRGGQFPSSENEFK